MLGKLALPEIRELIEPGDDATLARGRQPLAARRPGRAGRRAGRRRADPGPPAARADAGRRDVRVPRPGRPSSDVLDSLSEDESASHPERDGAGRPDGAAGRAAAASRPSA